MKTFTAFGVTRNSHHDYQYASRDMYGVVRFHKTRKTALRLAGTNGAVEKLKGHAVSA